MLKLSRPVFLLGLPGSGKTTVGKIVASRLSLPFSDLDQLIEIQTGRTISDIFSREGEEYFRKIETETLEELIRRGEIAVVSVGGGTPCFHNNMEKMLTAGHTCYLRISWRELAARNLLNSERPLFKDLSAADLEKSLENKFAWRIPVYNLAEITAEVGSGQPMEVANAIYERLVVKTQGRQ